MISFWSTYTDAAFRSISTRVVGKPFAFTFYCLVVDCGIVYLYIVTPFSTFRLISLFIDTKLVVIENTFRGAVQNVTRDDVCETVATSALTLRSAPYFFFPSRFSIHSVVSLIRPLIP